MGLVDQYLQGRSALPTAIIEAAGAFASLSAAHAAGDSFKFETYSLNPSEDRQPRTDVKLSRDDVSLMIRNRTNEWQMLQKFLPRGGAVPPDGGPFWRALLGTETIAGNVTYDYARVPPSLGWIVTGGEPAAVAQEKVVGAIVNEGTITLAQGEEPQVQFAGVAAHSVRALGVMTIAAPGTSSATQPVGVGEASRVKVGSIVEVEGIQQGLRVIDRNLAADTVTFDVSIDTGAGGQIVRPWTPWDESTTNQGGEPIASWNGSISIAGSTAHLITGGTIVIANNWTEKRAQFSQNIRDAAAGKRRVTGTLQFDAGADDLFLLAQAEEAPEAGPGARNPVAIILTLGDPTNGQCVITMPNVVLNFAQLSVPQDGLATFELPFHALSARTLGVPNSDAINAVWS